MNNMTPSISVSLDKTESVGNIHAELEKLCDPEYISNIPNDVDPEYVDLLPWLGPGMPKYRIIAMDTTFFLDRVILPHGWELVCPFEIVYPETETCPRYVESLWVLTHNGYVCHSFPTSDSGRTELWEGIKDFLVRVETAEVFADIRTFSLPKQGPGSNRTGTNSILSLTDIIFKKPRPSTTANISKASNSSKLTNGVFGRTDAK